MKSEDNIIKLFCVYTILSVVISIFAWLAVGIGLVSISPNYIASIGILGWGLACLVYMLGLFMVYRLKQNQAGPAIFVLYPAAQALALAHALVSQGWYYAPSAGSQGTVPALLISLAMLTYLFSKNLTFRKLI